MYIYLRKCFEFEAVGKFFDFKTNIFVGNADFKFQLKGFRILQLYMKRKYIITYMFYRRQILQHFLLSPPMHFT
jgi:hypothetical protein